MIISFANETIVLGFYSEKQAAPWSNIALVSADRWQDRGGAIEPPPASDSRVGKGFVSVLVSSNFKLYSTSSASGSF